MTAQPTLETATLPKKPSVEDVEQSIQQPQAIDKIAVANVSVAATASQHSVTEPVKTKANASRFFNQQQLDSLDRLGDIVIPKTSEFPSFSEVGCVLYIDEVMDSASAQDIKDFGLLLNVMRFLPKFMLVGIIKLGLFANKLPEFIAPLIRQLDIGVRGVIYTLYYANVVPEGYTGKQPNDVVGYHIRCEMD